MEKKFSLKGQHYIAVSKSKKKLGLVAECISALGNFIVAETWVATKDGVGRLQTDIRFTLSRDGLRRAVEWIEQQTKAKAKREPYVIPVVSMERIGWRPL